MSQWNVYLNNKNIAFCSQYIYVAVRNNLKFCKDNYGGYTAIMHLNIAKLLYK